MQKGREVGVRNRAKEVSKALVIIDFLDLVKKL
jgi:hypothetical protein